MADLWLHPKYLIQRDRKRGGRGGKVRRGKKKREKGLKQKDEGSEQAREGKVEREGVKEKRE